MPNTKDAAAVAGAADCADSVRLCDYKDCGKPLHKVLRCSKCKRTAYCCKECQVRPVSRAPVHVHSGVHTCMHTQHLSHANSLTLSPLTPACFTPHAVRSRRGRPGTSASAQRRAQQRRRTAAGAPCSRQRALRAF